MTEVPPTPAAAATVFGTRLELAERYVALLADTGISHGLIGPREAPRLWDRHVLNSAVVADLFGPGEVADIGSGAGLPGIPLAIVRPDLAITLVEPLARRTSWLQSAIDALGLDNVTVHRGRAESLWGERRFAAVTARAVARTGELARVCLPLLLAHGSLHALKGDRAEQELAEDRDQLLRFGPVQTSISRHGAGLVDPETVVLTITTTELVPVPGARRTPSAPQKTGLPKRGRPEPGRRPQSG
ncbi:MAG: 16S rRNA (guanine(527)-N(7))-methyltransferase RsmG [Lapillicoccus sp.]